jgi:hypothetical protein
MKGWTTHKPLVGAPQHCIDIGEIANEFEQVLLFSRILICQFDTNAGIIR